MGHLVHAPELVQRPHGHPARTTVRRLGDVFGLLLCSRRASGGSVVKNLLADARDKSSISGSGRSPGEGNGNSLQYYCLENPMDRGAWWVTVHGVAKSRHNCAHILHMFMKGPDAPERCPAYIMLHYLRGGLCVDSRVRHT